MSLLVERQFSQRIAFGYQRAVVKSHSPLKINFRCMVCGDSQKDAYMTRGWLYEHKGHMRYGCFNCSYNARLWNHLEDFHPDVFREFLLELRNEEGNSWKKKEEPVVQPKAAMPIIQETAISKHATRLDLLPDGHPAKMYMVNRMIPADKLNLFYFTMAWRELANEIKPETYRYITPEPRIVIPIFNEDRTVSSVQGRALRSTEKIRYVTVKSDEEASKVFGKERVNMNKPVCITEGPVDSVFLDNGIAITGGSLSLDDVPYKGNRIWCMDNEPRSIDTCKRLKKLIDSNEKVVIWNNCPWASKDINDMILKDGATSDKIQSYINSHTYQGLMASMEFDKWKRCRV